MRTKYPNSRKRRLTVGSAMRSVFLLLALASLVIHSPARLDPDPDDRAPAVATAAQFPAMAATPGTADADDLVMLVGCHHGPGHDHSLCSPRVVLAMPVIWPGPAPRHEIPQCDIPRLIGRADAPRAPPPRFSV